MFLHRDVLCGMLHCEHRSEKLMFWKEALMFTMPDTYIRINDQRHDCKAAIMDVGLDMPDPGLTFDGVKCGDSQARREKCVFFVLKISCMGREIFYRNTMCRDLSRPQIVSIVGALGKCLATIVSIIIVIVNLYSASSGEAPQRHSQPNKTKP